eukprot:TRINITY_DN1652_c0_g1_i1.p1 TRINITY_DN1652_c0_g1~~TRINITY_DN1652_c0_g1_i1.p1  ORF type:complete len:175 (+),score=39.17 TRINITY_DN1652_c0_g1_i1:61-585(+)
MMMRSAMLFCLVGVAQGITKVTITTWADGTATGGIRQSAAGEDGLDHPGNIFVYDQKLWNENRTAVIGRNAGYCVTTDPGTPDWTDTDAPDLDDDVNENWGQCTWTLQFNSNSDYTPDSTITVAGREARSATSYIAVVGGTLDFVGATGQLMTTPMKINGDLYFQQVLTLYTRM